MTAKRHVSSEQLAMFMTAGELRQMGVSPFDTVDPKSGDIQTPEHTWERKTDEAIESGLVDSIRERGVSKPINLYHLSEGEDPNLVLDIDPETGKEITGSLSPKTIAHGHHRVAGANFVSPNEWIPVQHYDRNDADPSKIDPFLFAVTDKQDR